MQLDGLLAAAADPATARVAVDRLIEGRPELAAEMAAAGLPARGFVALVDASRALSEAAIRDPALLAPLRNEASLLSEHQPEAFLEASEGLQDASGLRSWKRAELTRIALRDLLGYADLRQVGRELSGLADAALSVALRLSAPPGSLAIIGMGKLGGEELNYASDVDVLFVHEGDTTDAVAAARRLLAIMNTQTADGIVFRTDADLRPEGRSGPLSRTVAAFGDYYRGRAGHWERQALIKSRFVTGNVHVANQFFNATLPQLWDGPLDPDALREIRAMKARSEALRAKELKRGPGGIRDVEFAVQLLQLVHGRSDTSVRSGNTIEAIDQLARGGYLDAADAEHLSTAYRYLRMVEHRLQLRDEQQVYALPEQEAGRTRLARVLGYRDRPDASALEQFDLTHKRHLASVRSIHERLFFRPLLDALAGRGPVPADVGEQLAGLGFRDSDATRAAVAELTAGMSRNARQFQALMPLLLQWFSAAPSPDLGLLQLRTVADGPVRAGAVVGVLRESSVAGERLCRLLGSSKVVGRALRRHPEAVADLADDEALATPKTKEQLLAEADETLGWRANSPDRRAEGVRRFVRREELRIASRDLLGFLPIERVGAELSDLAEATLQRVLTSLAPPFSFAVIGMGKLGGRELSYASDLDVLFVHEGDPVAAERIAEALIREIGEQTAEGRAWEIDARLRPEGRAGALALTLDGYRSYWRGRAQLWERQALLRARPVAGDAELGRRFDEWRTSVAYAQPVTEDEAREIRRIKARVEAERIRPPDDREFHLKLGRGTLADVEWTVQLLQLRAGADDPTVRTASTMTGLDVLGGADLLDTDDAERLRASYRFCELARNARYLHAGARADSLPREATEAIHLARMLGFEERPETQLRETYRQVTRRARAVVERVFYGQT
jgi:glutamate-ammonia-ligase adenylyltransferase